MKKMWLAVVLGLALGSSPASAEETKRRAHAEFGAATYMSLIYRDKRIEPAVGWDFGLAIACPVGKKSDILLGLGFGLGFNSEFSFGPSFGLAFLHPLDNGEKVKFGGAVLGFLEYSSNGQLRSGAVGTGPTLSIEIGSDVSLALTPAFMAGFVDKNRADPGFLFRAEFAFTRHRASHK